MQESTNSGAEIVKNNLLKQLRMRTELMSGFLSEELVNPVYQYDMKTIYGICKTAGEQKDVISVYVFDKEFRVIYDNTKSNPLLGVILDDELSQKALTKREFSFQTTDNLMNTAAPIMIDDELLGGVKVSFSMNNIITEIERTKDQLNSINIKGVEQAILYVFVTAVALSIFSAIMTIFVIHRMSRQINLLAKIAGFIGQGKFDIDIPVKRSDEIGELANSFKMMAENLQHTTVSKDYFDSITRNMIDTLIIVTPKSCIKTVNVAVCNLLGFNEEELIGQPVNKIIDDEEETFIFNEKGVANLLEKGFISNLEKSYIAKDGRRIPMLFSASVMFNKTDEPQVIVCVAKDITEQKKIKEQLETSLSEKEALLQEVYHRTKNNMQIISSLLRLESENIKDEHYINIFKDSQNRIKSMALVHEKLYQSHDLSRIDFDEYLGSLTKSLFRAYHSDNGRIDLKTDIENFKLEIDTAIPCGLIVNELISNSLKYAFPEGRDGEVRISLHLTDDDIVQLRISDNGIGMPNDINYKKTNTLGLQLVNSLVKQLEGSIELNHDQGTNFFINFKKLNAKQK